MSTPSENPPDSALPDLGRTVPALARYVPAARRIVQRVAFWTAIVLPFLYLPLLAGGLSSASVTLAFLGLLALNALAVVVGHPHMGERD
jgi:hypothetical protein